MCCAFSGVSRTTWAVRERGTHGPRIALRPTPFAFLVALAALRGTTHYEARAALRKVRHTCPCRRCRPSRLTLPSQARASGTSAGQRAR
jgi:hypothetical protein